MDANQMELEKFKMQKNQLYLQVVSVILSGIFLYALISGKNKIRTVSNPDDVDDEDAGYFLGD